MTHKSTTSTHKHITSRAKRVVSEFGRNLLKARNKLDWTQAKLSQESRRHGSKEIHYNTIYNIETGTTSGSKETVRVLKKTITAELGCVYPWDGESEALNRDSLITFINNSHLVSEMDQVIADIYNVRLVPPESYAEFILERLLHVGIKTTSEMEQHLKKRKETMRKFVGACHKRPVLRQTHLPRGVCLGNLQILLLLENNGVRKLQDFLEENRIAKNANPLEMTRALKASYKEARK